MVRTFFGHNLRTPENWGRSTVNKPLTQHFFWIPFLLVFGLASSTPASSGNAEISDVSGKASIQVDQTKWILAVKARDIEILSDLLDAGYLDVNSKTESGKTALMVAAQAASDSLCVDLVALGADVGAKNKNGGTPLMHASVGGSLDIVNLLLRKGAEVNERASNGWSALMLASAKGFSQIVKRLIEVNGEPNIRDVFGWTPLMHAVEQNRKNVIELLVSSSNGEIDNRNIDGVTALHRAAALGYIEIVRILLAGGARADLPDQTGRTAVDYALESGNLQIAKELSNWQ
ncbi:ankyrin repeat domain-containing protein [Arenicellales bacterium IMCC56312]